jgi:hypothetical protein
MKLEIAKMKDGKFFRKFTALNVTLLAFLKHLIIFDEDEPRAFRRHTPRTKNVF